MSSSAAAFSGTQTRERPQGVVESCEGISGFGQRLRDYRLERNLVVGPLAILHAGIALPFWAGGQKLFVEVKGGHRVTLELSRATRRVAGLGFVAPRDPYQWTVRNTRRVVTFVACRRGVYASPPPRGRPVSGWVGSLNTGVPRCVPLLVWVDDERSPRHAVIPYGVRDCA